MILETLLGGVVGTATRAIPAVLEHLDKKNEREHERMMFERQIEQDKLRGEQKIEEVKLEGQINLDAKSLDALIAGNAAQAQMAVAAGGWAAKLSAAVRPVTTFQLVGLYMLAKVATFALLCMNATDPESVMFGVKELYNANDSALLSGVLAFWYMDRTIQKR